MYLARFGTKNLLGLNSKCSVGFCQFYKILRWPEWYRGLSSI